MRIRIRRTSDWLAQMCQWSDLPAVSLASLAAFLRIAPARAVGRCCIARVPPMHVVSRRAPPLVWRGWFSVHGMMQAEARGWGTLPDRPW
eukprot:13846419-Alexandrium_andersonii.AAC.1